MDIEKLQGTWFRGMLEEYRWECSCEKDKFYYKTLPNSDKARYIITLKAEDANNRRLDFTSTQSFSDFELDYIDIPSDEFKQIEFMRMFKTLVEEYIHIPARNL